MSCITSIPSIYQYVQAAGTLSTTTALVLSAPLLAGGGLTSVAVSSLGTVTPGLTRVLRLFGAPAYKIRVDASVAVVATKAPYVSVGISSVVDELVDTQYATPNALPANALRFNYGAPLPIITADVKGTASTFTTAVVPAGVYYVSALALSTAGAGGASIGTLAIEATPILETETSVISQNPAVLAVGSTAWADATA